jgi:hypothetical protein
VIDMAYRYTCLGFAVGVLLLASGTPLLAEPPAAAGKPAVKKPAAAQFIRIKRGSEDQPVALQTAIVRYVPASGAGGLVVDLISAVHIGDRAYYEKLNKQFEQYDVLLYELVAPPGTRVPRGGKRAKDNPISLVQDLLKTVLDLDSQTEQIDYTKKNFAHADLSPAQMAEAIRQRGDDGLTLFLSVAADLLRQQNLREMEKGKEAAEADDEDFDPFSLLLDPDGPVRLKRLLAQQMESLESHTGGLGPTLNTILITDRNQAALKVFQKELANGKKKIGIFYGAGHMPDFDKRLRDDFGLKRESEQWLTAWDLRLGRKGLGDLLKRFGR